MTNLVVFVLAVIGFFTVCSLATIGLWVVTEAFDRQLRRLDSLKIYK